MSSSTFETIVGRPLLLGDLGTGGGGVRGERENNTDEAEEGGVEGHEGVDGADAGGLTGQGDENKDEEGFEVVGDGKREIKDGEGWWPLFCVR